MANRENIVELVQQHLKNEFAKRYKINPARSLLEVKRKQKIPARNHSVLDEQMLRKRVEVQDTAKPQSNLGQTLRQAYLSHHNGEDCLCGSCNCGRHLCRLDVAKPELTKRTTYQRSFDLKGRPRRKQQIVEIKDRQVSQSSYLDIGSEYTKKYQEKLQRLIDRPHPQDHLKFQGPSPQLTTYTHFHPGHKGHNQYVKPSNNAKRGDYPLIGKSMYSTEFIIKKKPWDFECRQPDHLKTGSNWLGSSTYNKQFRNFNPEEREAPGHSFKLAEKYQKMPSLGLQFQTNYNKEFVEKGGAVCPSKVMLQSGLSQQFSRSKGLFQENSDFKGMSPQFQAISTSKHFYV